MCDFW
jgi:Fe-Mn family superoxide dismutase